jgi:hypothetical protein
MATGRKPLPRLPGIDRGNRNAQIHGDLLQGDVAFQSPVAERGRKAGADVAVEVRLWGHGKITLSTRSAPADLAGQFTNRGVVFVSGNAQSAGPERFGVVRRGEFAVVHHVRITAFSVKPRSVSQNRFLWAGVANTIDQPVSWYRSLSQERPGAEAPGLGTVLRMYASLRAAQAEELLWLICWHCVGAGLQRGIRPTADDAAALLQDPDVVGWPGNRRRVVRTWRDV